MPTCTRPLQVAVVVVVVVVTVVAGTVAAVQQCLVQKGVLA